MRRISLAIAALGVLVSLASAARAHTTGTGLLTVTVSGASVEYRLTLVLSELPEAPARMLALAAEGDQSSVERVADELKRRVTVRAADGPCRPGRAVIQGSRVGDSRVIVALTFSCSAPPSRLVIRDDWFDLFGEHYRTLARIETPDGMHEAAFLPDAREVTIDLRTGQTAAPGRFFRLGVEHILTGYDHLLFLAALLLPGGRLLTLFKIITAFTAAHSITLALAVLGVVTIPDRLVECVIAASIVWVALENVFLPHAPSRRWVVSFLFGLVHGFGFASTLTALELPPRNLALALLGFNVGVEAGQALVVALLLPLLVWLRSRQWEPRVVRAGSLVVAAVGFAWFVERLVG
ncbi:MAG TPA: HupE/UreJ family protein [Candidatus Methylomirabilis sp.]|nr:HupE/UreJ family protein [Candidatus Methylomirabilis sp.]